MLWWIPYFFLQGCFYNQAGGNVKESAIDDCSALSAAADSGFDDCTDCCGEELELEMDAMGHRIFYSSLGNDNDNLPSLITKIVFIITNIEADSNFAVY